MSKIKKESNNTQSKKQIGTFNEDFAYKSVIRSLILAGLILIISIVVNGEIIILFYSINSILYVFGVIIKVFIILLFFIFMMISIGNYRELTGKPIDFKIVMLLFILSVAQGFRNPVVFAFSFLGLLIILIYMYLVQEN